MRTIKFRGKRIDNGEWVYGDLFQPLGHYPIIINTEPDNEGKVAYIRTGVQKETVGQFTGLTDKNGKEIYEGDIVKTKMFGKDVSINGRFVNVSGDDTFEIKYVNAQFVFNNGNRWFYLHRNTSCEIIGNIHDNIELLTKTNNNDTTE